MSEPAHKRLPNPSTLYRRLRGLAVAAAVSLVIFPTLLLINVVQTLSVVLLPLSPRAFRRINRGVANFWWGLCASAARHVYRTKVSITGDEVLAKENVILLCNHQSMADIPVLFELAMRKGRLGDLKWYVKDVLKYVPGVGWGMLFLDCLFIKRSWTADKEKIRSTFQRIVSGRVPVWIISFAEGTRFTPEKAAKGEAYARNKGLTPLARVLLPRTKGFVATLEGLGDHADAILDCTIRYPDGIPTLWQWTKGLVPRVDLHVRRFPVADLPKADTERAAWLNDRFVEKDHLLASRLWQGQQG